MRHTVGGSGDQLVEPWVKGDGVDRRAVRELHRLASARDVPHTRGPVKAGCRHPGAGGIERDCHDIAPMPRECSRLLLLIVRIPYGRGPVRVCYSDQRTVRAELDRKQYVTFAVTFMMIVEGHYEIVSCEIPNANESVGPGGREQAIVRT